MVTKHTMRDFIGLEKADTEARKAMMNFSYLSAIGNMDEAFKAIKLIKRFGIMLQITRYAKELRRSFGKVQHSDSIVIEISYDHINCFPLNVTSLLYLNASIKKFWNYERTAKLPYEITFNWP